MKVVDLTLATPAQNLACDEALLDESEEGFDEEYLRFWEPSEYFVVVGSSNRIAQEVNVEACRTDNVPILRRHSGGGAVLQGPGCLNYCLILKMEGALSTISGANTTVLDRHRQVLEPMIEQPVEQKGSTDLAIHNIKFSGNSQRRRLRYLMFHGTFLLQLDLNRVECYLKFPSRQPDYRNNRSHLNFIGNIHVPAENLKAALRKAWNVQNEPAAIPHGRIQSLLRQRYEADQWTDRF